MKPINWLRRIYLRSAMRYSLSCDDCYSRSVAQYNEAIRQASIEGRDTSALMATRMLYQSMQAQERVLQSDYRRQLIELGHQMGII